MGRAEAPAVGSRPRGLTWHRRRSLRLFGGGRVKPTCDTANGMGPPDLGARPPGLS